MFRPSLITLIAAALAAVLFVLLLLPGIAGVIEGDFGYLRWELERGWNNKNQTSIATAISEIYLWSFWTVGLREQQPQLHIIYQLIRPIRPSRYLDP